MSGTITEQQDGAGRRAAVPGTRNVVVRRRVHELLSADRRAPATLVCAPAGYGKSLAAASWIRAGRSGAVAWVNLTSAHDTPAQVWTAIVDAIGVARPEEFAELSSIVALAARAPQEVPGRLNRWISARDEDTVLVIDDLHTVTELEVHEQLVELIAAAGTRLRLIAITRHDPPWPLHRMRLDGLLADLRTAELAFDADEAAELFDRLDLQLDPGQIDHLLERTQGWAAGLRLAAMGALSATDSDAFVEILSGRTDYIADYLFREVYEGLRPAWRDFLSRIGVVDEISPDLAIALGCGPDSADRLVTLVRQNAFIHQLGERPGWYRLHPLLLDFLRSRATNPAERRELDRRAAVWFQHQREPWLALQHAVAAQEWQLAGDLVGTHVVTWTVCNPPADLREQLLRIPREHLLSQPGLAIGLAASLTMAGQPSGVPELVHAAQPFLELDDDDQRGRRYGLLLDLIEFGNLRWSGDIDVVLAGCRRIPSEPVVLGNLGLADWASLRTLLISNIGACEVWTGELDDALTQLVDAAREEDNRPLALPMLNAQAHLAYLHWQNGDLRAGESSARTAIERFARLGLATAVQAICAYLALAGIAVDRDEIGEARHWLALARRCTGEPHTQFAADLIGVRLLAAQSDAYAAIAELRRAQEAAADAPFPRHLRDQALLLESQLLSVAGNAAGAQAVAATISDPRALAATTKGTRRGRVDACLARARKLAAGGDESSAATAYEQALALAAPELLRRPFLAPFPHYRPLLAATVGRGTGELDFALDVMARMTEQGPGTQSRRALLVPLTERESNLLRHLATTMTTKEIADKLYVSVNTIKTHQRSIYQKLGAKDRRQAVSHGRELGLI